MARTTNIEPQFAAWLAAVPLVESLAGSRVYPFAKVPQNSAKPYVTYFRVSRDRWFTLTGPSTRVMETVIQVGCWGGYQDVSLLADALTQAIDQDLPRQTIGGIFVQAARVIRTMDDFEPPRQGDEQPEMRVELDAKLVFEEG